MSFRYFEMLLRYVKVRWFVPTRTHAIDLSRILRRQKQVATYSPHVRLDSHLPQHSAIFQYLSSSVSLSLPLLHQLLTWIATPFFHRVPYPALNLTKPYMNSGSSFDSGLSRSCSGLREPNFAAFPIFSYRQRSPSMPFR